MLGQGISHTNSICASDREGRLGHFSFEGRVLGEAEFGVELVGQVKHFCEFENILFLVLSEDSGISRSFIGQSCASEIIDYFNCRAAVDALLTQLANRLDLERLA